MLFFSGSLTYREIMKLQPVESSMIKAVGYDETTSTLEVVFNSGKTYSFSQKDEVLMGIGLRGHRA